ncbi:hypothetical protein MC885_006716 [Smutsia gigantea]|nr:hypothetical protein MC885_006716 [Smutsia gigantea]
MGSMDCSPSTDTPQRKFEGSAPSPWWGPLRGGAGSLHPGNGEWSQNLDVTVSSNLFVSLKGGAEERLPAKHRAQRIPANENTRTYFKHICNLHVAFHRTLSLEDWTALAEASGDVLSEKPQEMIMTRSSRTRPKTVRMIVWKFFHPTGKEGPRELRESSFWDPAKMIPGREANTATIQVTPLVITPKVTILAFKTNTAWTTARYLSMVKRMTKKNPPK